MILRFVSMRHGNPFSMRVIVIGDIFAARASSDLLINRASLVFLNVFCFICELRDNVFAAWTDYIVLPLAFMYFDFIYDLIQLPLSQVNYISIIYNYR